MEGDSLRSAIDIYALQITVALDDSLGIEAVILHQYRIAVGIIGVMVVADLRRGSRMAVVLIPVCEVVRLCRSCGIHLLHLGKRLAHASEGHRHLIRCTLCLAACLRRVYGIGDAFASCGRHAVSC